LTCTMQWYNNLDQLMLTHGGGGGVVSSCS
jgi:hypothetical protein